MTREIKFRTWSKKDETMDYGPSIDREATKSVLYFYPQDEIIMQYTGLKDKAGKEIYEGDIVKGKQETDLGTYDILDIVELENGCYRNVGWDGVDCYYSVEPPVVEIIGNIYENPDLISKTKHD